MADPRPILWRPSPERILGARITQYEQFLQDNYALHFADYNAMWRWSVSEIETFWESIWRFFQIPASVPHTEVLSKRIMPGAKWFSGAHRNYTDGLFRYAQANASSTALISQSETFGRTELTWGELHSQVASVASRNYSATLFLLPLGATI